MRPRKMSVSRPGTSTVGHRRRNSAPVLRIVEDIPNKELLGLNIHWTDVEHRGRGAEGEKVSIEIQSLQPPPVITVYNPEVKGFVSGPLFAQLLEIYQGNQWACLKALEPPLIYNRDSVIQELTKLEIWFLQIIEPPSLDDPHGYIEREKGKLQNFRSFYCREDLETCIGDIPDSVKLAVATNCGKIGNLSRK